jgi:hypothetical protein
MSVIQMWLYEQMVTMWKTKELISLHYAEMKQNFQTDSGLHMKCQLALTCEKLWCQKAEENFL